MQIILELLKNPLIILMGLDVISGVIASGYERKLSSKISWNGFLRKSLVAVILLTFKLINNQLFTLTYLYFAFNEMLSIVENADRCGVKLPKSITEKIERAGQEYDILEK